MNNITKLGVICVFECANCGSLRKIQTVMKRDGFPSTKDIKPTSCECGNKNNFSLVDFTRCEFVLLPEGYVVVPKSETVEEQLKPENNPY